MGDRISIRSSSKEIIRRQTCICSSVVCSLLRCALILSTSDVLVLSTSRLIVLERPDRTASTAPDRYYCCQIIVFWEAGKNIPVPNDNGERVALLKHLTANCSSLSAYESCVFARAEKSVLGSRQACLDAHDFSTIAGNLLVTRREVK